MKNITWFVTHFVFVVSLLLTQLSLADDDTTIQLAATNGCLICHSIEPLNVNNDPGAILPVGPAYQDVAERYKDNDKAYEQLVEIVKHGSNPYQSHWKGRISGLAMPPSVALGEEDAKKLVKWILSLTKSNDIVEE